MVATMPVNINGLLSFAKHKGKNFKQTNLFKCLAWSIHNVFVVYGLIQICRLDLIALYQSSFLSVGFTKNYWVQIGFHAHIIF